MTYTPESNLTDLKVIPQGMINAVAYALSSKKSFTYEELACIAIQAAYNWQNEPREKLIDG